MNYLIKSMLVLGLTLILSGCPAPAPTPASTPAAGDTTAPVVTAPANIIVNVATGVTSVPKTHVTVVAFLGSATANDGVDGVITNISNNAPITFSTTAPTTVTFSATDAAGNTGTATATVTVVASATTDAIAPVVTPPANLTVNVAFGVTSVPKTDATIVAFLAGVTATDNVDGTIANITNNAPATFSTTAPTTVTFSAVDSFGNVGTATATVTVVANTPSTPVSFTVIDGQSSSPIQGAVIRVDATDYTTDVNGQVLITGADVGLHDFHVFANGYDWVSLYQATADAAANTFELYRTGAVVGGGPLTIMMNIPTSYVPPATGVLEATLTDVYGNVSKAPALFSSFTTDPYTGISTLAYSVTYYGFGQSVTGTLAVSQVTCDATGFNCTSLSFTDVTQTFDPATAVVITDNPAATAVPVTSPDSRVVLGLNMTNTLLAVGATYDTYTTQSQVRAEFLVAGASGAVTQHVGYLNIKLSGTNPQTILSTTADVRFMNIPVGSTLTGNLTLIETQNLVDSNYVDLGQVTLTTVAAPYVYVFNNPTPAVTYAAVFPAVPPTPSTVLTVNSAVAPTGMFFDEIFVNDASYIYYDSVFSPALPHSFTSLVPVTGSLSLYVSASDPYTQSSWDRNSNITAGSVVDVAASLTAIPSIAANQTGSTIQLSQTINVKTAVSISIIDAVSGRTWNMLAPTNVTSVTLPTPPVSITNPWVVGQTYQLSSGDVQFSTVTYAQFATAYMGGGAAWTAILNSTYEGIDSPLVPYTY